MGFLLWFRRKRINKLGVCIAIVAIAVCVLCGRSEVSVFVVGFLLYTND